MIEFEYKISEVITNIEILSQYRSNSMVQKGNDVDLDDSSSTFEDEKILTKYLKQGVSIVGGVLSGYSSGLLDTDNVTELKPFEFNTEDDQIIFRMNVPDTFQENVIDSIDEEIKDFLENYVLSRINIHRGNEFESYLSALDESKSKIRGYISRRTETVKRNYNLI